MWIMMVRIVKLLYDKGGMEVIYNDMLDRSSLLRTVIMDTLISESQH